MKKAGFLVVAFMTLFTLACGGGDGGGDGGGAATPTVVEEEATLLRITLTEWALEPEIVEMKVGQPYRIQLLNRTTGSSGRLRMGRWDLFVFALAGEDSELSRIFTPEAAGDYSCTELLNAAKHGVSCTARVVP